MSTNVSLQTQSQTSPTTPTFNRIGVIGGGQLAWMMAQEAQSLGIELLVQTPSASDPAASLAADTILAPLDNLDATAELASRCDVITFENEFVDLEALGKLAQQGVRFRPSLDALAPLLDKYDQRCYLREIGLPVPEFFAIAADPNGNIPESIARAQFPLVMKARRHGYDGQGTAIVQNLDEFKATWQRWGYPSVIVEAFIPFDRELAAIAARNPQGDIALYPVVETQQEQQVCRRVLAPANLDTSVMVQVEDIARTLLETLQAVGVFGIELFLTREGKVLVNEIAPRTHNSGHFSLDACQTSQFAQHLRATAGLPLGNTALECGAAAMVNLLGFEYSDSDYGDRRQRLEEIPGACVRWYGKTQSRPGRKLGHVTVLLDTPTARAREEGMAVARTVESIWYPQV
jgi:5-(carboxyamino)imidazole ribonucleotide synthase